MNKIEVKCPAKINLDLRVLKKTKKPAFTQLKV